jgi:hypothetical protein
MAMNPKQTTLGVRPLWRNDMPNDLQIICPVTGKAIPIDIKTDDVNTLKSEWRSDVSVKCPYCGDEHHSTVGEAYAESALILKA